MKKTDTLTGPMFLVYEDENGERHFQPWQDLVTQGTLTDENGDLEIVGWCVA